MSEPRCDDVALLHPTIRAQVERMLRDLDAMFVQGRTPYRFEIFETWRSPRRQFELFQLGVTKAMPWRSAHQFGLAVDVVPKVDGKWSWEVPSTVWSDLRAAALRVNLDCPISWDRAHVESGLFRRVRAVIE